MNLYWDKHCLAVDLGTTAGYAANTAAGGFSIGSMQLASRAEISASRKERLNRRRDPRILKFFEYLSAFRQPDIVIFEDVEFQSYTLQCQLWSSFRAALWLAFPKAHFECVPVTTLKKFATGHGAATKEMMARALVNQLPSVFGVPSLDTVLHRESMTRIDNNAVDAMWLWLWARKNLSRVDFSKQ